MGLNEETNKKRPWIHFLFAFSAYSV